MDPFGDEQAPFRCLAKDLVICGAVNGNYSTAQQSQHSQQIIAIIATTAKRCARSNGDVLTNITKLNCSNQAAYAHLWQQRELRPQHTCDKHHYLHGPASSASELNCLRVVRLSLSSPPAPCSSSPHVHRSPEPEVSWAALHNEACGAQVFGNQVSQLLSLSC